MALLIHAYRLSLIWTDVELAQADGTGPLSKLRSRAGYEATVDQLRGLNGQDGDLRLPWWRKVPTHFYWLYYFNRLLPDRINGAKAWNALAPLQLAKPLAQIAMGGVVSGGLRGYISPQATGLVAEMNGIATLTPEAWVEQCHAIRTRRMEVIMQDASAVRRRMPLQDAATDIQARLRALLGQRPAERALAEPSTVVSVLKADGIRADRAPNASARRWVHAVSAWPTAWKQVSDDPAGVIPFRRRDATKSDFLYGTPRGRAVWMPSRFLPTERPVSTLSCYHHNITLAGLQVEMLLDFVRALKMVDNPTRLNWSAVSQRAAGLFGRLHGGTDDIYRSATVSRHISDSGLVGEIDLLRTLYGMPKLKAKA
jgi:hypothetical protein